MYHDSKIIKVESFQNESFRKECGKIVLVKGVFDLTHAGHVRLFQKAKEYGDTLVVAVASDKAVKERKGADRPILTAGERGVILSEFLSIDWVVYYEDLYQTMLTIRPDIFCASHFEALSSTEKNNLVSEGIKFVEIKKPDDCMSTTKIIKKIWNARKEKAGYGTIKSGSEFSG